MVMISQYVCTTGNPCHYPSIRPFRYDVIIDQSQPTVQVLSSPYSGGSENPISNRSMLYKNFSCFYMDNSTPSVVVFGHSFVRRLRDFLFDQHRFHCPLALAGEVFAFARTLQKSHWSELCDRVSISELLPRLQTHWAHYDVLLHRVNKQLKVILAPSTSLLFWPHFGLWKTWQQNFIADGIHLNPTSPGKYYYRSMRGAVLRAARQLQEECGNRSIIAHSPALLVLAPGSFHATTKGMIMRRSAQNPNISQC